MDLVEVEITGMVVTAQYGTLKTGDVLRTDAAFAKHLVEDCSAAKYITAGEKATPPDAGKPVKKDKKTKPEKTAKQIDPAAPINPTGSTDLVDPT